MNNISNKLKNLKVAKQNENLVHGVMDVGGEDCGEDGDDEGCGEVCSEFEDGGEGGERTWKISIFLKSYYLCRSLINCI